jgi:hypothetical protein
VYFTTPHFDGYPAILVRLDGVAMPELEELLVEAWLSRAPKRLATKYLDAPLGGHYSRTRAHHDAGRLPIPLEGRVLGCINLTWRMKLMTVAEVTRRHTLTTCAARCWPPSGRRPRPAAACETESASTEA